MGLRGAIRSVLARGRDPRRPGGIQDGRLAPCPDAPCCVASQAGDDRHRIEPLPLAGTVEEARNRLLRILRDWSRAEVVAAEDRYVHAIVETPLLGFRDDVELLIDPDDGVIHVRSASRVGYSDLGTNRRRVERLREELETATKRGS